MEGHTRRTRVIGAALGSLMALLSVAGGGVTGPAAASTAPPPRGVTWMAGDVVPGTPTQYDKVGVIKVGPRSARNVLVLEPGTNAGSAYFVPLAQWIVATLPGWQVWSVERRENLLEDQSELNLFKQGRATATELYNYYLGYLKNPSIADHVKPVPDSSVAFAKSWGMSVAVQDLHAVIGAAKKLGGKVVLGGHSLGGAVVTAYATWDFAGKPGADDLNGLVYIDGSSDTAPITAAQASQALSTLNAPTASPWLSFGGITAPYAGIFSSTGGAAAFYAPNAPSLGQTSGLLPPSIVPPVRATNEGQFGYALNVGTSPTNLLAAQAHLGRGLSVRGPVHGWNGTGALTPISHLETMYSGSGILGVDGVEWHFPQRLTDDTGAVGNGISNPAQAVLGLDTIMGRELPKSLLIYAFGARLGGPQVLTATRQLAQQSGIPARNLTLVNRQSTYAHNDPAGAYPNNVFFQRLIPFLRRVSTG